jgi:2-methylcitrate dehydratase PrpD
VGHPASLVVPTAMVLGEFLKTPFPEILQAIIVGYEIGTRFSYARIPSKIATYSTGRWGAIATAATAALLLKLNREQTIHALSNAAVLSPAMLGGSTDVSTGSMSKEGVAWAAQAGLQSAIMAKDGFSGPYLFVDEVDDYDKEKLLEGLGHSWLINSNYFKPYACCRWLHSPIEATLKIKEKFEFDLSEIEQIKVRIFQRAIDLVGNKYPENTVQAQFHLPFVVAVALVYGRVVPSFFGEGYLQNKETRRLIDKTVLMPSGEYSKAFPEKLPSSVKIVCKDGRTLSKEILTAPWDADCQPTDDELKAKFLEQTTAQGEVLWDRFFHSEKPLMPH